MSDADIARLIMSYNIIVRELPLPGARGSVSKKNNSYIILISPDQPRGQQRKTLLHELLHIKLEHLDRRKDLPEWLKELEVNQALKELGI